MLRHASICALLMLAIAASLAACSPTQTTTPTVTTTVTPASAQIEPAQIPSAQIQPAQDQHSTPDSAVKAYIDPITGELRGPTPAELAAEAAAKKQSTSVNGKQEIKTSREIIHSDGSVEVQLDQSHDEALQACVQKDGSITMDHGCLTQGKK